jgi:hypothetical protein
MLGNSKPFALADTRNWSSLLVRSGHVSIFLTEICLRAVDHLLLFIVMAHVDREIFSVSVAFVEKVF